MTDKPTKADWETLADKESAGRDLSRETSRKSGSKPSTAPTTRRIDSG